MTARLIQSVGRLVDAWSEPVLVAPRGLVFHRCQAILYTNAGRAGHVLEPVCHVAAGHDDDDDPEAGWVAIDEALAVALGRHPCGRCNPPDRGLQLTVSDVDPEAVQ